MNRLSSDPLQLSSSLEHLFLEDVQGMFRAVLDHIPSRIFWKDTNLVYLGCNLAFARDAGCSSPEEVVGKTDYDLSWNPDEARKYRRDDREVLDTGKGKHNFEESLTRTSGVVEWLETTKRPLRSANGKLVGVLGIYQIITERKEAEIKLREAQAAAEAANKTKGEFLATMSHEIRSPLTVLLGYTELLKSRLTDAEELKMLEMMDGSGQSLREIIDDILDLSKIESLEVNLKREAFDPEEVLRRQFAIMANSASERGLAYELQVDPGVPKAVLSDAPRWSQIIRNLLSNAIKFTKNGSVKVRLSGKPSLVAPGESVLTISVSDTGIGMTPETISGLFQKFYRGDSSTEREFGGTGLGLYISRRIARLLGGDVLVQSEIGAGSEFTVRICCPISIPLRSKRRSKAEAEPQLGGKKNGSFEIVVVDDLPSNLHLVRAFLKQVGFGCHTFPDVDSALEHLKGNPADIIFTDIEMPRRNGLDFARTLRELGNTSKIVAMTAGVLPEERQRCFDAGMDSYIAKPFQIADLTSAIALAS